MPTPRKINDFLSLLRAVEDRQDRIEMLIGIADRFREVPPEVAKVEDDLPLEIFGHELSMGKTMGLNGMVAMVRLAAARKLRDR